MARLYYMSLPGVGQWDVAMKEVGAQFGPYQDYLVTAKKAAERRKLALAWRAADDEEAAIFGERLRRRYEERNQRAARSSRRRDRRTFGVPTGAWVVLDAPPWRPEEPDDTFDAFFEAKEVYEALDCARDARIEKADYDREGRALLLERLPTAAVPDEDVGDAWPTATAPHGPIIWLRPNTYTIERQLYALRDLENAPPPRLAPLVRLASTRASWPAVAGRTLEEQDWVFLRPATAGGALKDGTDEQRRFVAVALATEDFALLEGPPGSGKTTAICELIAQLARERKRVLLVASTHVAVDNVLERLIEWQGRPGSEKLVLPVRIGDEDNITSDLVAPWTWQRLRRTWRGEILDFLEAPLRVDRTADGARRLLADALVREAADGESIITRLILESANLVCGTTIGILQHPAIKASRRGDEPFEPFDVLILDEASKTTFTEFLVPAIHARRWIVVGDVKQLSPYIEEVDLAENLRGLLPEPHAQAAVHAFLAAPGEGRPASVRSVLATSDDVAALVRAEADPRGARLVDLDAAEPRELRGVPGAIPELLYADLVAGSPDALRRFEHRLPPDLLGYGGPIPELPDFAAARRAFVDALHRRDQRAEVPDAPVDWADEVSWRLVRSYELRMNAEERGRYRKDIEGLLPTTLDDAWFEWREMRPRAANGARETALDALARELATIRRVAMPSILELLQEGFERLPGWDRAVTLTDGLPAGALEQRFVSLSYQHRMHPHISAFPREQFYTPTPAEPAPVQIMPWAGNVLLASLACQPAATRDRGFLHDARAIESERAWSYPRYARRALWLDVAPQRGSSVGPNTNLAEVCKVIEELQAFVVWAQGNRRRDGAAREMPWEVAVLTFYRGQEKLLREELRRLSGERGNTHNFHLPRTAPCVTVTVCTVDRFQGHEADLVLLSFVKSGRTVGFLNSPNRLNVALTRARYQIVLIGHRAFFQDCRSPLLQALGRSEHYRGDIGWEAAR